jgi:hypothetical protein
MRELIRIDLWRLRAVIEVMIGLMLFRGAISSFGY